MNQPDQQSDEQLALAALQGDREAFTTLYERYFDQVYDLACRVIKDTGAAGDVAQNIFMKFLGGEDVKPPEVSFRAWLYTMTRNASIDELRRRRRTVPIDEAGLGEEPAYYQMSGSTEDPERVLADREITALVWQAAKALNPNDYTLLDLNLRKGLEPEELAQTLGTSRGNVYTRLSRLRDSLEEAVTSLILAQHGRQDCEQLNTLLQGDIYADVLTPRSRRVINRHIQACEVCESNRRRFVSASALFGGLAVVTPAITLKTGILGSLLAPASGAAAGAVGAASVAGSPPPTGPVGSVLTRTAQVWESMSVGVKVLAVGALLGSGVLLGMAAAGLFFSSTPGPFPSVVLFRLVDPDVGLGGIASNRTLIVQVQIDDNPDTETVPTRWLINEGPIAEPSPQDAGWMSSPPDTYTLSAGDGLKAVNLWLVGPQGTVVHSGEYSMLLDTTTPLDPDSAFSPTHQIGEKSTNNRVTARWSPARDPSPGSGISGYSINWDQFPNTVPDQVQDIDATIVEATSPALASGAWYMHLSTLDRAGNYTTTIHLGPFVIGDSSDGPVIGVSQPGLGEAGSPGDDIPPPEEVIPEVPPLVVEPNLGEGIDPIPEIPSAVTDGGSSPTPPESGTDGDPENPSTGGGEGGTASPVEPDGGAGPQGNDDDDDDGGAAASFPPAVTPVSFQSAIEITVSGDAISTIGAQVSYQIQIINTSSADTPALVLDSIIDTLLGDLTSQAIQSGCGTLLVGASCSFSVARGVQSGAPDPLVDIVEAHYHPQGFGEDVTDSDNHSVDLFQPSVEVTVSGDSTAQVGDTVSYTYNITNTGSNDTPDLELDSITDTLLGDLTNLVGESGCETLGSGDNCTFSADRQIAANDPDPLVNTVEVHYHPQGFGNDVTDSDSHSVKINIPQGNSPPKAADDLGIYRVDENSTLGVSLENGVLANDDDPDGDSMTAEHVNGPNNGTLAFNADGSFAYTPNANFNGLESFKYQADDGTARSGVATVDITVLPVNQPPVADPLSLATDQGTSVGLVLTGSDLETALKNLIFNVVTPPATGSLTGSAPNLTYTPNPEFAGSDSFTFTVTDRGDPDNCGVAINTCAAAQSSSEATVSIEVSSVNSGLIQDLAVSSPRQYEVDILDIDQRVYTDRSYEFTDVPAHLIGKEFIRTANNDKSVSDTGYISFNLAEDARLYILFDHRAATLPAWLDDGSWTMANDTVDTSDVLRSVYYQDFLAGNVRLGGNAVSPMAGAESNYNVVAVGAGSLPVDSTPPSISITFPTDGQIVNTSTLTVTGEASDDDAVSLVEVGINGGAFETANGTSKWSKDVQLADGDNNIIARATDTSGNTAEVSVEVTYRPGLMTNLVVSINKAYEIDTLETDKKVYIDRGFKFKQVSAALVGKDFIRTANDDKSETAADFIAFDLTLDARVYILFDNRVSILPAWLDNGDWILDSITQDTTDVLRRVYYQDLPAGTVQLGGNAMAPMSGARSNYNVVVGTLGLSPS